MVTLQQIIDERISFLKEQINPESKPKVNETFQVRIDAIRSVDDMEKVESIINEKKAMLKKRKDVYESEKLFAELNGLEWFCSDRSQYTLEDKKPAIYYVLILLSQNLYDNKDSCYGQFG